MRPWLSEEWGNASTREYRLGWNAADAIEEARDAVGQLICAPSTSIVFTSGATESLSTAIRGFVGYRNWESCKIVTFATEHSAVLGPCEYLAKQTNFELSVLPVNPNGGFCLDLFRSEVRTKKRCLVAIMAANNEVGTLHPTEEVCKIAHDAGALVLCDASQAIGKIPMDFPQQQFDFAAFSSHKMCGPKGIGALYLREGIPLEPLIVGGGQEHDRRGGTSNVPAIVGFGRACAIAFYELVIDSIRVATLRDKLERSLLAELTEISIHCMDAQRLCNTSNIGFFGIDSRALIRDMNDIYCSTKAACSSGDAKPSHVLKAIGLTDDEAFSSIRFSLGKFTTESEIDYSIDKIVQSVRKLRRSSI